MKRANFRTWRAQYLVLRVRQARTWCSSAVFERGVRARCSSAKRENFYHVSQFNMHLVVTRLRILTLNRTTQIRILNSRFAVDHRYASQTRATTCKSCPAGRFSNKEGASSCKMCKDYTTSVAGSDQCSSCDFFHMGSTDCSEPVVGILLGVFGSAILIFTCFVGIKAYRKKDAETRLLKDEALHLKSDLNAATLKELEAKHDVEALTAASRIEWSSIELNDKPFARGMFLLWNRTS